MRQKSGFADATNTKKARQITAAAIELPGRLKTYLRLFAGSFVCPAGCRAIAFSE
jgi:hypothetical protein